MHELVAYSAVDSFGGMEVLPIPPADDAFCATYDGCMASSSMCVAMFGGKPRLKPDDFRQLYEWVGCLRGNPVT